MQNNKWCVCSFLGSYSAPVRVTVENFVGDSVIFSCSIPKSKVQDKIEKVSVNRRDNEGKNVFDIVGGNGKYQDQAPEYKDRVESFPEEYKKGNFSIKLNSIQISDARKYHCHITGPSQNYTITELQVEGVYNLKSFTEIILFMMYSSELSCKSVTDQTNVTNFAIVVFSHRSKREPRRTIIDCVVDQFSFHYHSAIYVNNICLV